MVQKAAASGVRHKSKEAAREAVRSDFFSDTSPESLEVFFEALRRLGPNGRLKSVFEQIEFINSLSESDVRQAYPEADEREVFLRTAARRLGNETVRRVYGWDPESGG